MAVTPFRPIDPDKPPRRGRGRPTGEMAGDVNDPGPDYSVEKFYTRASDTKGHREYLKSTQYPPHLQAAIVAVVDACPELRSIADFDRNAAYHYLVWFSAHTDDLAVQAACRMGELEVESDHRYAQVQRWNARLDGVTERLKDYARQGDSDAIEDEITNLREYTTLLRGPYRERALEILDAHRPRPRLAD